MIKDFFNYALAITRPPCATFADGLTHGLLGKPDLDLARVQHRAYVDAIRRCGVEVMVLDEDDAHPDSCFMEDPAIVTEKMAVIVSPCMPGRQGEEKNALAVLEPIYGSRIEYIRRPGTLEGGDICRAGNHFLIGLSRRTNEEGARQLAEILKKYGYTSEFVDIRHGNRKPILHLTTAMSFIDVDTAVLRPELADEPCLQKYRLIVTPQEEAYAGNTTRFRDHVLVPQGFNETIRQIQEAGFQTIEIPMSEFEKQDGGLSCLSLRMLKE